MFLVKDIPRYVVFAGVETMNRFCVLYFELVTHKIVLLVFRVSLD